MVRLCTHLPCCSAMHLDGFFISGLCLQFLGLEISPGHILYRAASHFLKNSTLRFMSLQQSERSLLAKRVTLVDCTSPHRQQRASNNYKLLLFNSSKSYDRVPTNKPVALISNSGGKSVSSQSVRSFDSNKSRLFQHPNHSFGMFSFWRLWYFNQWFFVFGLFCFFA